MANSDVTVQDGLKHPYLVALVRWCLSSFWSAATVVLQRLIAARIPRVQAAKQCKSRPASYGHLHPEPRVECEVLHAPAPHHHTLDVVFVHGLYGSLGNTWRQGEWQTKYENGPKKVALRRPHAVPTCRCTDERTKCCSDSENDKSHHVTEESHDIIKRNETNNTYKDIRLDYNEKNKIKPNNENHDELNNKTKNNNQIKNCSCGKNVESENDYVNNSAYGNVNCCDIERDDKIRQKNLKDDINFRNNISIIKATEININSDNILDYNTRIPSSNNQKNISDIDVTKDYFEFTDDEINHTNLFSNVQTDYVTCNNRDLLVNEEDKNIYDIQKILPKENLLITEKFYNNTLLDDVDIGSYETQAQFVKDLFENSVKVTSDCESESGVKASDCKCDETCEPGCGCICDDCYSPCWPRDWIREDYPGARVISINYTSDPYLWRPLWVKESKRLRLHERAEQMTSQLLALGVGERPVIWVGHSKGGLFIKKIYCDAYEAHLKLTKQNTAKEEINELNTTACRHDNEINQCKDKQTDKVNANLDEINNIKSHRIIATTDTSSRTEEVIEGVYKNIDNNYVVMNNDNFEKHLSNNKLENKDVFENLNEINANKTHRIVVTTDTNNVYKNIVEEVNKHIENNDIVVNNDSCDETVSNSRLENRDVLDDNKKDYDKNGNIPNLKNIDSEGDKDPLSCMNETSLLRRAGLWRRSAGFMFYSVPHRGSPLADIKTPITARSVELMEICKDCPLVLSLQDSWSAATAPTMPPVRSVVETCRTLMSVLYLRIVSVDSADPGIGSLSGVDVDHREICKPSGRACLLYRELMTLMETALQQLLHHQQ